MNFESFSHGQIESKLWLCSMIEPYLPKKPSVIILGAWYNVLGLMLLVRQPERYAFITGVDVDPEVKPIADKICEYWTMGPIVKLKNEIFDANLIDFNGYNVVINCSVEHMKTNDWFNNISNNSLVCIQSCNLMNSDPNWNIINPNPTLEIFRNKYPLSHIFFSGEKDIQYETWGYKRFMIIGIK